MPKNGGEWFGRQLRDTPIFVWAMLFAILGFLAFALPPVIRAAAPTSDRVACLSNVKQIGTSFLVYANDHDERLPEAEGWMDTLHPYTKSRDLYHCPTIRKEDASAYGYAFNCKLAKRRLDKLERPDDVPYVIQLC